MIDLLATFLGVVLAGQSAGQVETAPREAFHVACGERVCRVQNRYAEFEVTRGDVRVQRILGHVPGDRVQLRLTPMGGGRPDVVPLAIGRGIGNQIVPMSRAAAIKVADCRLSEDSRSATADPCLINLADLDAAVENARMRLTLLRRR
jgi:hypothetical protein